MKSLVIPKKANLILILLVTLLLLAASGCGGNEQEVSNNNPAPANQTAPKGNPGAEASGNVAEDKYANLLTIQEVEEIGEFANVQTVGKNPAIGAGGDINFAIGDDLILIVQVQGAAAYETTKASQFYKEDLAGLGDEALWGSSGVNDSLNGLCFRKGDQTVSVVAFNNLDNGLIPYFNQEQLLELAQIVLDRL